MKQMVNMFSFLPDVSVKCEFDGINSTNYELSNPKIVTSHPICRRFVKFDAILFDEVLRFRGRKYKF